MAGFGNGKTGESLREGIMRVVPNKECQREIPGDWLKGKHL